MSNAYHAPTPLTTPNPLRHPNAHLRSHSGAAAACIIIIDGCSWSIVLAQCCDFSVSVLSAPSFTSFSLRHAKSKLGVWVSSLFTTTTEGTWPCFEAGRSRTVPSGVFGYFSRQCVRSSACMALIIITALVDWA